MAEVLYLLRLAGRNALRNRRRSIFTLSSIGLGVAWFIVSRSFVDGIDTTLIDIEVKNESGHIRVVPEAYLAEEDYNPLDLPFPEPEEVALALVAQQAGTEVVSRVSFAAEVGDGRRTLRCRGVVIDREAYLRVFDLGALPVPPGDEPYLWAGIGIASTFGWKPGDRIFLKAKTRRGTLNALDAVRFAGSIASGHPLVDNFSVFLPRDFGAEFLDLPPGFATEVLARFPTPSYAEAAEVHIENRFAGQLTTETWLERTQDFRDVNALRRSAFNIIVALIMLIGAAGAANTAMMSAFERTGEIGTLLAVGLSPSRVRLLLAAESVFIAAVGAVLGALVGLLISLHFARVGIHFEALQGAEQVTLVPPILYFDVRAQTVQFGVALGLLVAFLAALWPAVRASRLSPIDALREGG